MRSQNKIRPIFDAAVVFLGITLGVAGGYTVINSTWQAGDPDRISAFVFLALLLLWLIGWFVWDIFETRPERGWLGEVSGAARQLDVVLGMTLGVIIAIVFSLMILLISNIPAVILIFGLVVLGCSIGDHMIISGLPKTLSKLGKTLPPELHAYYFDRPHLLVHCIQLTLCVIAAVGYYVLGQTTPKYQVIVAYGILAVSILINESVLWSWRVVRLRDMDERDDEEEDYTLQRE